MTKGCDLGQTHGIVQRGGMWDIEPQCGEEAFNGVTIRGKSSMQRDFSWVVTNAISAIKNMVCFDVAQVLGKEESTSLCPLSHPSPSQSVTKMR